MEIVGNHLLTKSAMIHQSITNDGQIYDIDMELGSKNSYEEVSYWLIKNLIRTKNS